MEEEAEWQVSPVRWDLSVGSDFTGSPWVEETIFKMLLSSPVLTEGSYAPRLKVRMLRLLEVWTPCHLLVGTTEERTNVCRES